MLLLGSLSMLLSARYLRIHVSTTNLRGFHSKTILRAIETTCSDPRFPCNPSLKDSDDSPLLPPCVHHIRNEIDEQSMLDCIVQETALSPQYVSELADFGALYYGKPIVIAIDGEGRERGPRPKRVISSKELSNKIAIGSYIRVHQNPIRKRIANKIDWMSRVIDENDDYVVLNKPAGVPMGAGVDNLYENIKAQLERVVTGNKKLYITGRLDVGTTGVCVLAKNKAAAAKVHAALRDNKAEKIYKAQVNKEGGVETGLLLHSFKKGDKTHRSALPTLLKPYCETLLTEQGHIWKRAALEILACEPLPLESASSSLHEITIRLITGRTHQIRLQLSAIGAPIIGDTRYAPVSGLLDIDSDSGEGGDKDNEIKDGGMKLFGRQPDSISLHCASLEFLESAVPALPAPIYASAPWE